MPSTLAALPCSLRYTLRRGSARHNGGIPGPSITQTGRDVGARGITPAITGRARRHWPGSPSGPGSLRCGGCRWPAVRRVRRRAGRVIARVILRADPFTTAALPRPSLARCCTHLRGSHVVIHWPGGSHALASGGHATARWKLQGSTACDHSPAPAPDPRLPGLQFDRLISEGDPKSFLKTDLRRSFAISPFRVFVIPKEITSRKHESRKARKGPPGTVRRLLRVPSSYKGLSAEHFVARSGHVSYESGTVGMLTCVQQRARKGGV